MATPTSSPFAPTMNQPALPTEMPPINPLPPSDDAQSVTRSELISRRLQAMILETSKQQVIIDPTPLPQDRRFVSPSNFLQFSMFAEAVRERLRGRIWNAKFEAWITLQLGPAVAQRYSTLTQTLPTITDYQPFEGYIVSDVKFAGIDDFQQKFYDHFFASQSMQQRVFAAISEFQVVGQERFHFPVNPHDRKDSYFSNCLSLCDVAIRAFELLKGDLAVPETAQCSFILTRLPKFAQLKLQEWYEDLSKTFNHFQLLSFASRVDRLFSETKRAAERTELMSHGILKVNVDRSRSVSRTFPDSPVRKRFRSISPSTSRSPTRFSSSREQSPVFYRSQKQYKGTCAKCGKEGHSIARCRYATADEKSAFFKKVKETKAKKAASYQNTDKTMKKPDSNKKVKFADKNPLEHTNADMQH
jgi:hypothetical protein